MLCRGRRGVWMLEVSMAPSKKKKHMMLSKRYCQENTSVSYAFLYHDGLRHRQEQGHEGAGQGYRTRPSLSES